MGSADDGGCGGGGCGGFTAKLNERGFSLSRPEPG